mmetsp:Transcript_2991/g.5479  ORF Transcript_2991/g.5479 Transcript_2991/m.5479 type:complete len:357 (+) Transcript_2991:1028-2098(+)
MDDVKAPKMFHEFLGITASIETGSAGTEGEEINIRELVGHFFKASKGNFVGHETTTKTKGSTNCFRLFITLFQSPMRKRSWAQLNLLVRRHLHPSQIQRRAISMQDTDFPILHTDEILCVPIEGRRLRCNKHAIRSDPDNQGRTIARHDELIGGIRAHNTQPPRAITPYHGLFHGISDSSPVVLVNFTNELCNDFGIRLARKFVSPRLKLAAEFVGIVECAVVDEGKFARAVEVGVGVFVRFSSVCGPTGVCDADVVTFGCNGAFFHKFETISLFSDGSIFSDRKSICRVARHGCNASTVISTILQNGKSLDQILPSIALGTHNSSNTTALGIVLLVHGSGSGKCPSGSKKSKPGR